MNVTRHILKMACIALLLLVTQASYAQPNLALDMHDFFAWTTGGVNAQNICSVPLSPRVKSPNYQLAAGVDANAKVLYCPDGMNNFGPYIDSASQFNLFNFSHWQYIDILAWFGGSASNPVIIPTKAWVDAAHKAGVKVIGTVFMAPTVYGGSQAEMDTFLQQDGSGHFLAVNQLKAIANYYNFDGWIMNFETPVTSATGALAAAFMDSMHVNYSGEVIWYDALIQNGSVSYQNRLDASNNYFFEHSTGLFTNYSWNSAGTVTGSATYATGNGDNPFNVYTGADMWPTRNAQPAFTNYTWIDKIFQSGVAKTSLAMFATNFTFNYSGFSNFNNDPNDYANFYGAEREIFSGVDKDPFITDNNAWKGLSNYMSVRTTVTGYPFTTTFNTGHGLNYYFNGSVLTAGPWHNMSHQEILPSWTFYTTGITVDYDFTQAYNGGSSLNLHSTAAGTYDIPLYSIALPTGTHTISSELVMKTASTTVDSVAITMRKKNGTYAVAMFHPLDNNTWEDLHNLHLPPGANDTLTAVDLKVYASGAFNMNVGMLGITNDGNTGVGNINQNASLTVYPNPSNGTVYFNSANAGQLAVYDLSGKTVLRKAINAGEQSITLPVTGVYMYELVTPKGTQQGKIIVNK